VTISSVSHGSAKRVRQTTLQPRRPRRSLPFLGSEVARLGIRVNVVAPGLIETR